MPVNYLKYLKLQVQWPAIESSKRNSITFLDIKTEQTILNALKEVRTFGLLVNGHVGLYTSDSTIAFELVKIE